MPLLVKPSDKFRLDVPNKPDEWVEVRPVTAGDLDGLEAVGVGQIRLTRELMASVIVSWSDEEPVSIESVKMLDLDTFMWLSQEILARSGVRSDSEKKDSATGLSRTQRRNGKSLAS